MSTLFVLLLTVLAVANGFLLTFLVIARASLPARLCYGSVVGLLALAWVSFLVSLAAGLNATAITLVTLIFAAGALVLYSRIPPERLKAGVRAASPDRWGVVYYLAWAVFLGLLFSRVVSSGDGGMYTAPANNFGDLPFHFSVITSFAYGENLPPRNPIFAGLPFTYPFLIDFLTAFFRRAGADWPAAFFIENIILSLSLVGVIELMTLKLTGHRLAARIAPVLFLFNGGFGFVYFLRDLGESSAGLLNFLAHLPRTYTMSDELHLRWGNVFTTLLIPQRSLLFGLPTAAMIISLWWQAVSETEGWGEWGMGDGGDGEMGRWKNKETRRQGEKVTGKQVNMDTDSVSPSLPPSPRRRYLLAAGVLAGLMPMAHAHGFFSVMIVSVLLALLFFSWDWLAFFIPAGVLSLPQALWLRATPTRSKMFEPHFGWEAYDLWRAGQMSPLTFWLINAGAFLLLLALALLVGRLITARLRRFYLPFLICFILPNAVLLAPWAWDNIKVLIYWYLASCPLVAALLTQLFSSRAVMLRIIAAALLVMLTLSGAVDVLRGLSPVENVQLFSRADLTAAELIRQRTPPRALLLNAPIHNSVVALTGRQPLMGYPGHLWTHGIESHEREQDVRMIYQGGAEAEQLLKYYGVDYVVIGPIELGQFSANEEFFAAKYPVVVETPDYHVYRIK